MDDRWGPDPTPQLWRRWRRPVLIAVGVLFVVGQWERLASGEPFAIATGLGVAAFFISVVWRPAAPAFESRADADVWRRHARRSAALYGSWTVMACAWLGLAAIFYSVRPVNFVVPAIPAVLTLAQVPQLKNPERFARLHQEAFRRDRS